MITVSINNMAVYCCVLFASSTLLQGFPALDALNRVFIILILFVIAIGIFLNKMKASSFFMILLAIVLTLISALHYVGVGLINNIMYLGFWVLFFEYMGNHYDGFIKSLRENIDIVHIFVLLWTMLVIASFFYPGAYRSKWGGEYFRSFATGAHRMASVCPTILAAAVLLARLKNKKRFLLYLLLPIILILISGARTYLGVAFLFAICLYYSYCPNKRMFYYTVLPVTIIMITVVYFSPMWDKMMYTTTTIGAHGDTEQFLRRFTSGRTYVWVATFEYFFNLSLWRQIVGDGADATIRVIYSAFGQEFFAHNDFINILVCNGCLGIIAYLSSFLSFTRFAFRRTNTPLLVKTGILSMWFFNAMFNQAYTYPAFVLAMPLLLYALTIRYRVSDSEP